MPSIAHRLLPHQNLRRVTRAILQAAGSEPREAKIVTDHLVQANLMGHDSHGVGMIPAYIQLVKKGLLKPNTPAKLVHDNGTSILQFDGGRGYGHRVAQEAMATALDRVRAQGVVLLTLRNASHIGRIGTYGEQATSAGFASLHFVNVTDHMPMVIPYGGADRKLGTNPICIAIPGTPARPSPVVLDMATSRIAQGKARVAMNEGKPVVEGSILDAQGFPTNEPRVLWNAEPDRGGLLTMGEYKGYGLALMCEILAGAFTGGGTLQPTNPQLGGITNNMLTVVIDPNALVASSLGGRGTAWFQSELDGLLAYMTEGRVAPQPPVDPSSASGRYEGARVQVAGEPERQKAEVRSTKGIPVDQTTWAQLLEAGTSVGVLAKELERLACLLT